MSAQYEASAKLERAAIEAERSVADEAKAKVAAERHELMALRAALERELETFDGDVAALRELGIKVRRCVTAV